MGHLYGEYRPIALPCPYVRSRCRVRTSDHAAPGPSVRHGTVVATGAWVHFTCWCPADMGMLDTSPAPPWMPRPTRLTPPIPFACVMERAWVCRGRSLFPSPAVTPEGRGRGYFCSFSSSVAPSVRRSSATSQATRWLGLWPGLSQPGHLIGAGRARSRPHKYTACKLRRMGGREGNQEGGGVGGRVGGDG